MSRHPLPENRIKQLERLVESLMTERDALARELGRYKALHRPQDPNEPIYFGAAMQGEK